MGTGHLAEEQHKTLLIHCTSKQRSAHELPRQPDLLPSSSMQSKPGGKVPGGLWAELCIKKPTSITVPTEGKTEPPSVFTDRCLESCMDVCRPKCLVRIYPLPAALTQPSKGTFGIPALFQAPFLSRLKILRNFFSPP